MWNLAKTLVTDLTYKSSVFICGIIEVDRCFDSKREFVLEIKLNSLPKDVFFLVGLGHKPKPKPF